MIIVGVLEVGVVEVEADIVMIGEVFVANGVEGEEAARLLDLVENVGVKVMELVERVI